MCGRFSFWATKDRILSHYKLDTAPEFNNSYNVTPSNTIPVVRQQIESELINCQWGFIPHWANDSKIKPVNARAETLKEKAWFRDAYRNKRCLIPANGFFEWTGSRGQKQAWFIKPRDMELFSFAGLWDCWLNQEREVYSCAIITSQANTTMQRIHERMPVIIEADDYDAWLTSGPDGLLLPYSGDMEAYPVSNLVNKPGNDGKELIQALEV